MVSDFVSNGRIEIIKVGSVHLVVHSRKIKHGKAQHGWSVRMPDQRGFPVLER